MRDVSCDSQRIIIFRRGCGVFAVTSVLLCCYHAIILPVPENCLIVLGSAENCHLQLLERHVCEVGGHCQDQSYRI